MTRTRSESIKPANLAIAETVDQMVVHHSDRLHVGVDDGRTNEGKSATFEILAERVRFGRGCRNPRRPPPIHFRSPADEAPTIGVERSELFLNLEERARVADCARDFQAVSNDPGVRDEFLNAR